MANITIRNISQSVFDKLKLISRREKRSLNNEILRVIELGLSKIEADAKTIIKEIYEARTPGREVEL